MKTTLLQKIIFFSLLIVITNGLIGFSIYINSQKNGNTNQLVQKSEQVLKHSALIFSRIKGLEAASRGYVITQDSVFLKPFNRATSTMLVSLDQLKFLTVNNPSQRRRVDSLSSYMQKRLDFSLQMIELRNKEGLTKAIDYVSSGIGKNYTDSIRKITDSINEEEGLYFNNKKSQMNTIRL